MLRLKEKVEGLLQPHTFTLQPNSLSLIAQNRTEKRAGLIPYTGYCL